MKSKLLLTGMICGSAFMLGAADFKFGSTLHYYWDEHPIEESMRIMKEGGQNAVRLENSWGNNKRVYDENGNFRLYPRVDEALNLAKEKNITALVLLAGTHPKIKNHFPSVYGLRKSTDEGAVVISYRESMLIDSGDAELKKIQINLDIKQWKGVL